MAKFTKSKPLTIQDRLAQHKAASEAAVSAFIKAASDLENAGDDLVNAATEAEAEARELSDLAANARLAASQNYKSADKIRDLLA